MGNEVEHEETARIILMQLKDDDMLTFAMFVKCMRDQYTRALSLHICKDLYEKYVGWDGRVAPTHNFETGEPL